MPSPRRRPSSAACPRIRRDARHCAPLPRRAALHARVVLTWRCPPAQKAKLRKEYIGFGGSETQATSGNPFLNIILGITALVALAYLGGIRP